MSDDSQSQINALRKELDQLRDELKPKPAKTSSMQVSGELKLLIIEMRRDGEKQEDVVWRIIGEAEKVPLLFDQNAALENENAELKKQIAELVGIVENEYGIKAVLKEE
jgi:Mg2+ and Co2+ transporter CorA